MSKLYFRFGTMSSSKSANALMTKFNYEEKGYKVLLLKPKTDQRDGKTVVKSRIGLEAEAEIIEPETRQSIGFENIANKFNHVHCVIVDEAQFLSRNQIDYLKNITIHYNIPIFCYGLRTDFQSNLFEGSKRLFEIADSITELKSICHCGKKAIINARHDGEKVIYEGEQVDLGGNEKYIGLCYDCWKKGKIK